jgi:hypothetical protein
MNASDFLGCISLAMWEHPFEVLVSASLLPLVIPQLVALNAFRYN